MVEITLQPRVQKDKWSVYWKESMATKTDSLESTTVLADINTTVAALQQVSKSSVEQFVSFIACQHILRVGTCREDTVSSAPQQSCSRRQMCECSKCQSDLGGTL